MKVGDLVRRKDPLAEWRNENNPWMLDREMTGVVVAKRGNPTKQKSAMVRVHWFTDGVKWWYGAHKLEAVKKCP